MWRIAFSYSFQIIPDEKFKTQLEHKLDVDEDTSKNFYPIHVKANSKLKNGWN